jgi:hypothetical protein
MFPKARFWSGTRIPTAGATPNFFPSLESRPPIPKRRCRSDGAARVAAAAGYSKAFNVLEGFEGDKDARGQRGELGGWRKAGLPWVQG